MRSLTDRGLRLQLRIFFVIFIALAILVATRIVRGDGSPIWAIGSFAAGTTIGAVMSRTKALSWDPTKRAVVGTIDATGALILVLYLVFLAVRDRLLGRYIDDASTIAVIGLSLTAGVMIGRILFTSKGIRGVLVAVGLGTRGEP